MSSAEQMAAEFEKDGGPEITGTHTKRSKGERVEHKHNTAPGDDTRKVVQIAQNGEAKRRENNK